MSHRAAPSLFPEVLGGGDPAVFCEELRLWHGFDVGPEEVDRIARLLIGFEAAGVGIDGAEAASEILTPIIARSPEDQRRLGEIVYSAFGEVTDWPTEPAPAPRPAPVPPPVVDEVRPPGNLTVFWASFALVLVAFVAVAVIWGSGGTPVASGVGAAPPDPGTDRTLLDALADAVSALGGLAAATPGLWLVAALAALMLAGLGLAWLWLRRLGAERDEIPEGRDRRITRIDARGPVFFTGAAAGDALRRIAGHRTAESRRIDVPRTLDRTIRQGGLPAIVRLHRRVQPEFLILMSRASADDQVQLLVDDLASALRREEVHVTRYDFAGHPDRLTPVGADGAPGPAEGFGAVRTRADGRQVLVVADPATLFRPGPGGSILPWLRALAADAEVTVLSTIPFRRAGDHLARLAGHGIRIGELDDDPSRGLAHALAEGATAAGQPEIPTGLPGDARLLSDEAPDEDDTRRLRRWLLANVSRPGLELLAAFAVYPEVTPGLTRALARRIRDRDGLRLATDARYLEIAGLAWMRAARFPDWAGVLVRALVRPERLAAIETDVAGALTPRARGNARLSFAVDRRPELLRRLLRLLGRDAPGREAVVARAPRGNAFRLPRAMIARTGEALWQGPLQGLAAAALSLYVFGDLGALRPGGVLPVPSAGETLTFWFAWLLAGTMLVLNALALSEIEPGQHAGLRRLAWMLTGGSAGLFLSPWLVSEYAVATLILGVAFLARGRPDTGAPAEMLFRGSTLPGAFAAGIGLTLPYLAVVAGGVDLRLQDIAALTGLAGYMVLARRLRLPMGDLLRLPAISFAAVSIAPAYTDLPDVLYSRDFPTVSGGILGFAVGAAWAAVILAHLDWRGVARPGGWRPYWPILAGIAVSALANAPAFLDRTFIGSGALMAASGLPLAAMAGVLILTRDLTFPGSRAVRRQILLPAALLTVATGLAFLDATLAAGDPDSRLGLAGLSLLAVWPIARWARLDLVGERVWTVFHRYDWGKALRGRPQAVIGPVLCGLGMAHFGIGYDYRLTDQLQIGFAFDDLAFPLAAWAGYRYGARGFWAVAVGALPYWIDPFVDLGGIVAMNGLQVPSDYFACLLLARIAGMPDLRHAILRTANLTGWQVAFLCLGFLVSYSYFAGDLAFRHSPENYVEVVMLALGMSQVRARQFLRPFAVAMALSVAMSGALPGLAEQGMGEVGSLFTAFSVVDVIGFAVAFLAGRALVRLIEHPMALDHLAPRIAPVLALLIVLDAARLELGGSTELASVSYSLTLVPGIALFLGFLALGYLRGWRGVFMALGLEIALLIGLPVGTQMIFGAPGPFVTLWQGGDLELRASAFFRDSPGGMSLGTGILPTIVFGYFALAILGLLMRNELEWRAQPERKEARIAPERFPQDPGDAHRADVRAIRSRGQVDPDGHPVLRALWLDRWAVLSGLLILLWVPGMLVGTAVDRGLASSGRAAEQAIDAGTLPPETANTPGIQTGGPETPNPGGQPDLGEIADKLQNEGLLRDPQADQPVDPLDPRTIPEQLPELFQQQSQQPQQQQQQQQQQQIPAERATDIPQQQEEQFLDQQTEDPATAN